MKFFHISDLHIGKRVFGFSMLEDQRCILGQILEQAAVWRPDGILIAGDLYDKAVPSAEAVELADWFLSSFAAQQIPVWTVCGNHDSPERIAYGSRMMEKSGIFMSPVFDGRPVAYRLERQEDGSVGIFRRDGGEKADRENECREAVELYLLPFLRPSQVRKFYPDRTVETTQQAVEAALEHLPAPGGGTKILVLHQFAAGAAVCESEELSVGGSDQVDVSLFEGFDYVALGHLHRPQAVGRETVRYCGSPLKYSFSEANQDKSVTVILTGEDAEPAADEELRIPEKGSGKRVRLAFLPLIPKRDLREIRGPIEALLQPEILQAGNPEDYLHVTLTDSEQVLDAVGRLRAVYPNMMHLDFERQDGQDISEEEILIEEKTPEELFADFFLKQNGREMSAQQRREVRKIWKEAAEE